MMNCNDCSEPINKCCCSLWGGKYHKLTQLKGKTMKLFTHKGYTIWVDSEGYYGMTKDDIDKCPHCAYKYLWSMLQLKGL